MFGPGDPETSWLTLTNIALGLVTLVCIIAVASIILREVFVRVRARATMPVLHDDHSFDLGDLGITMADGGKRIDEEHLLPKGDQTDDDDSHFFRSNN